MPSAADLPSFLTEVLHTFQGGEVDGQGEDSLGGPAARGLGAFLIAFSRTSNQAQELRDEVLKLREELTLQAKKSSQRKAALHQELVDLRQIEKETKTLLFKKYQEALLAHSKILPLRNEVIELKEKAEEVQAKMAKLEERATQQEVQLGQLEGELARKVELFNQNEEELTNDAADAYGAGFEDAIAQVAYVHPGMDLSQLDVTKQVVDWQLVAKE